MNLKNLQIKILLRVLVSVLIFQIGFSFPLITLASDSKQPNSSENFQNPADGVDRLQEILEKASPDQTPPKAPDPFHQESRKLVVYEKTGTKTYSIDQDNPDLSSVVVSDPRQELSLDIDREKNLVKLVFKKGGKDVKAEQIISGLNAVQFYYDLEVGTIITSDGRIFAVDMGLLAADFAINVPVVLVGYLPQSVDTKNITRVVHVSQGVPFAPTPETKLSAKTIDREDGADQERLLHRAGSLYVYGKGDDGKEVLTVLDEKIIRDRLATSEIAMVSVILKASPPGPDALALNEALEKLKTKHQGELLGELNRIGWNSREMRVATAFSEEITAKIAGRAARNFKASTDARDEFNDEGWAKTWNLYHTNAQKAVNDKARVDVEVVDRIRDALTKENLSPVWKELIKEKEIEPSFFRKILNAKAMVKWATIAAGGVATLAGLNYVREGHGPEWAVYAVNWAYENIWPDVLKADKLQEAGLPDYRMTNFLSIVSLFSIIPISYSIAKWVGDRKGWDFRKAITTFSLKGFSLFLRPFYDTIFTSILRQDLLVKSFRRGFNPFGKVEKNSTVGQRLKLEEDVRPGLNAIPRPEFLSFLDHVPGVNRIFKGREAREKEVNFKADVLRELSEQNKRKNSYAAFLALLAVAHREGVDPVTLKMALSDPATREREKFNLFQDPNFKANWEHTAQELYHKLGEFEDDLSFDRIAVEEDIRNIEQDVFKKHFEKAQEVAKKVKSRNIVTQSLASLKYRWNTYTGMANSASQIVFGQAEYEYIKSVEPNSFVSTQVWEQFWVDHLFTVLVFAFFGDRADLANKDQLAADKGGWLFTNKFHLADTADQVFRVYFLALGANLALNYQRTEELKEGAYDATQSETLKGPDQEDTLWSAFKKFIPESLHPIPPKDSANIKGIFDIQGRLKSMAREIRKADLGGYWRRDFVKRWKIYQANLTLSTIFRMTLGGVSFVPAVLGYHLVLLSGTPWYAWPWLINNRRTQQYGEYIEELTQRSMEAKIGIDHGIAVYEEGKKQKNSAYMEKGIAEVEASTDELLNLLQKTTVKETTESLAGAVAEAEKVLGVEITKADFSAYDQLFGEHKDKVALVLTAKLRVALNGGDREKIDSAYQAVIGHYSERYDLNRSKLAQLNSRSLLLFAERTQLKLANILSDSEYAQQGALERLSNATDTLEENPKSSDAVANLEKAFGEIENLYFSAENEEALRGLYSSVSLAEEKLQVSQNVRLNLESVESKRASFANVVRLANVMEIGDLQAVKSAYQALKVSMLSKHGALEGDKIGFAKDLLEFTQKHAPVPNKQNARLGQATIFFCSVLTTLLATSLMVASFPSGTPWIMKFASAGWLALRFYGFTSLAQFGFNTIADWFDKKDSVQAVKERTLQSNKVQETLATERARAVEQVDKIMANYSNPSSRSEAMRKILTEIEDIQARIAKNTSELKGVEEQINLLSVGLKALMWWKKSETQVNASGLDGQAQNYRKLLASDTDALKQLVYKLRRLEFEARTRGMSAVDKPEVANEIAPQTLKGQTDGTQLPCQSALDRASQAATGTDSAASGPNAGAAGGTGSNQNPHATDDAA